MSRRVIALVLAGFAVTAIVVSTLSIDRIVAHSIERYGSEALGTEVSVGAVTIDLVEGRGRIAGLRVAQPEGFGSGDVLSFGEIVLDVDVASLANGAPYVLELVSVDDPVVAYVLDEDGESNLDVLERNLERAEDGGSQRSSDDEGAGGDDDEVRLRVDRLEVEGGRIHADMNAARLGEREAELPAIRLDRIGGARGLPPDELAAHIGQRFVSSSLAAVTAAGIGDLVKRGGRELRGLFDRILP